MCKMSVSDIAAAGGAIVAIACTIRELGNNYYLSTAAWRALPEQVKQLERKYDMFRNQLERYGLSDHPDLLNAMAKAKELIEGERARLDSRRESSSGGAMKHCCGIFGGMIFPAKVGAAIQSAETACDRVLQDLALEQEVGEKVKNKAKDEPMTLPFQTDGEYVPRTQIESEILRHLVSDAGSEAEENFHTVVLLHGAAGGGKSTLLRQVSLQLQSHSRSPSPFSQVVWLECGLEVDIERKLLELLEILGWSFADIAQMASQSNDFKTTRRHWLRSHLRDRKVLIVLDDVEDLHLLRSLLKVSGTHIKYLVASRNKDLCEDLGCNSSVKLVAMEILSREDAQKILALNAGFPKQEIPPDFQKYADAILDQADSIPLAIATLGAQIRSLGNEREFGWKAVSDSGNLPKWLAEGKPSKHIYGDEYPRSYWATLKHGMDRLRLEQKQLFLLVGMCTGLSVPDAVVEILYCALRSNTKISVLDVASYFESKMHLESLHFLTKVKNNVSVSMHPLTKTFVLKEMKDEIQDIFRTLVQNLDPEENTPGSQVNRVPDEMSRLAKTLVCLYLDPRLDPSCSKLVGLCSGRCQDTFNELRRTTIEPMVRLLVLKMNGEPGWTDEYDIYSIQVFMTFIYQNRLHNEGIAKLLSPEVSVHPIMKFLATIGLVKSFWQDANNSIEGIPDALLSILWKGTHPPDVQVDAVALTMVLSVTHERNCNIVMHIPNMLNHVKETLSSCLAQMNDLPYHSTAGYLIALLASAARYGGHDIKQKLADCEMLLIIGRVLVESRDPGLRGAAALTFAGLTRSGQWGDVVSDTEKEIPILVANCPGLLDKLVESLQSPGGPAFQETVTSSLSNLALMCKAGISEKVINTPGMLDNMSKLLAQAEDDNPNAQGQAALVLLGLTMHADADTIKDKIASSPLVLEGLAQSLSKYHNPLLQNVAVGCLQSLCGAQNVSILEKLLDCPGLLESLVSSVTNNQNLILSHQAVGALRHLALFGAATMKVRLANQPGLLEALAEALRNRENPPLQNNAAGCLAVLADTEEFTLVETIVKCPNLLKNLAESLVDPQVYYLIEGTDPDRNNWLPNPHLLRPLSASVLATLIAKGNVELLKDHFVGCPKLLDNLTETFLGPNEFDIQENGTRALVALAPSADKAIAEGGIVDFPKLLEKLAKVLADAQDPDLQEQVARVMCGLSSSSIAIKTEIAGSPGLLKMLAEVLLKSRSLQFQEYVAQVTSNLLQCEDSTVISSFTAYPGLLKNMEERRNVAEARISIA